MRKVHKKLRGVMNEVEEPRETTPLTVHPIYDL